MAGFGELPDINGNTKKDSGNLDISAGFAPDTAKALMPILQADITRASTLPQLYQGEQQAHAQYQQGADGLLKKIDGAKQEVEDAGNKLLQSRTVPGAVGRVLSLFGINDYNEDYQAQRIDNAARGIKLENDRVNALGTMAQESTNQANLGRASAQNIFTSFLQAKQDKRGDASLALAQAADARAAEEHKVGMQIKNMQLANAKVGQMSLQDLEMAANKPDMFPDLPKGAVQIEINQRKQSNLSLENAAAILEGTNIGNQAKRMELVQNQMTNALTLMSNSDFSNYFNQAKQNGYAMVALPNGHQIKIPDQVFKQTLDERMHKQAQRDKEDAELYAARAQNPSLVATAQSVMQTVQADKGFMGSITPGEATKVSTIGSLANTLANDPDNKAQLIATKKFDEFFKTVETLQKRYIESAPEKERQGLQQYHASGQMNDTTAAANFYTSRASADPVSPMSPADLWSGADTAVRKDLANRLKDTAGVDMSRIVAATGGKGLGYVPNGKLQEDQLMQLTLNENAPKYKADVVNRMAAKVLTGIVADLAQGDPTQNRPPIKDYSAIYANGDVTPQFKDVNGAIDENKIYRYLAQQDATTGSNNVDLLKSSLNSQQNRQKWVASEAQVNNTPEHAALRRILFNNDTSIVFPHLALRVQASVQQMAAQATRAVQSAQPFNATTQGNMGMYFGLGTN